MESRNPAKERGYRDIQGHTFQESSAFNSRIQGSETDPDTGSNRQSRHDVQGENRKCPKEAAETNPVLTLGQRAPSASLSSCWRPDRAFQRSLSAPEGPSLTGRILSWVHWGPSSGDLYLSRTTDFSWS